MSRAVLTAYIRETVGDVFRFALVVTRLKPRC